LQGTRKRVKTISDGGFFGEVALVTKHPRAADCVAASKVKVLSMGRDAFERLMGPVEEILAGKVQEYERFNNAECSSSKEVLFL
jgi:cAMP-dependent protein kinase regulator